jgi:hypothetical protein
MKKVKIMLSAILVLAIVGGVLAFKAPKKSAVCFYTTLGSSNPGTSTTACKLDLSKVPGGSTDDAYTRVLDIVNTPDCGGVTETQCDTDQTIFITDGN